jgi:hypothetical protein
MAFLDRTHFLPVHGQDSMLFLAFPGAEHIGPGTVQTNILLFLECPESPHRFSRLSGTQDKLLFLAFNRDYYIRSFLLGLAAAIFFINLLLLFISPLLDRN